MSLTSQRYRQKITSRRRIFRRIVLLAILAILLLILEPASPGKVVVGQRITKPNAEENKLETLDEDRKERKEVGLKRTPNSKNLTELLEILEQTGHLQHENLTGRFDMDFGNYQVRGNFIAWFVIILIGFNMASSYLVHRFYEKYKNLKPFKQKLIKTEIALNNLKEELESTKRLNKETLEDTDAKLRDKKFDLKELRKEKEYVQDFLEDQIDRLKNEQNSSRETWEEERKYFQDKIEYIKEKTSKNNQLMMSYIDKAEEERNRKLDELKASSAEKEELKKQNDVMKEKVKSLDLAFSLLKNDFKEEREKGDLIKEENRNNLNDKKRLENDVIKLKRIVKRRRAKEDELIQENEKLKRSLAAALEFKREFEAPLEEEKSCNKMKFGRRIRKRISALFRRKNKKGKDLVDGEKDGDPFGSPDPVLESRPKTKRWIWKKSFTIGGGNSGDEG